MVDSAARCSCQLDESSRARFERRRGDEVGICRRHSVSTAARRSRIPDRTWEPSFSDASRGTVGKARQTCLSRSACTRVRGCSSRIWAIHERDLSSDLTPFEFPLASPCRAVFIFGRVLVCPKELFPLQELICKPQVRLDDDIEPSGTDKAIRPGEGQAKLSHHLSNTNCGAAGNANSAVYESGRSIASTAVCESRGSVISLAEKKEGAHR